MREVDASKMRTSILEALDSMDPLQMSVIVEKRNELGNGPGTVKWLKLVIRGRAKK